MEISHLVDDPLAADSDDTIIPSDMHHLEVEQKSQLATTVAIFPSSEKEGLGKTTLIKHAIDVGNARPVKQRYHAVSPAVEMLELDVIEESNSPWSSPVTIVAKSNGKSRLCLDARQVNLVTTKDAYPMPLID